MPDEWHIPENVHGAVHPTVPKQTNRRFHDKRLLFAPPHNILNRAALPLQTGATEFGRRQCDTGEDDIALYTAWKGPLKASRYKAWYEAASGIPPPNRKAASVMLGTIKSACAHRSAIFFHHVGGYRDDTAFPIPHGRIHHQQRRHGGGTQEAYCGFDCFNLRGRIQIPAVQSIEREPLPLPVPDNGQNILCQIAAVYISESPCMRRHDGCRQNGAGHPRRR